MDSTTQNKSAFRKVILILSIGIPIIVALLFKVKIPGYDFSFLPPIYASINAFTAILLIAALIAIKKKKVELHKKLIQICMFLALLFFIGYILYHATATETYLGDLNGNGKLEPYELAQIAASTRIIYFIILISHILLSISVIPLVLFSYLFAIEEKFERHRKIAKITWPIWLYVAISGVIVYLMISPYYPK